MDYSRIGEYGEITRLNYMDCSCEDYTPHVNIFDNSLFVIRDDIMPGGTMGVAMLDMLKNFVKYKTITVDTELVYSTTSCYDENILSLYAAVKMWNVKCCLDRESDSNPLLSSSVFIQDENSCLASTVESDYVNFVTSCADEWHDVPPVYDLKSAVNTHIKEKKSIRRQLRDKLEYTHLELYIMQRARHVALHLGRFDECYMVYNGYNDSLIRGILSADVADTFHIVCVNAYTPAGIIVNDKVKFIMHHQLHREEVVGCDMLPFPSALHNSAKGWVHVERRKKQYPNKRLLFWNSM
jgi:hypothetical protein